MGNLKIDELVTEIVAQAKKVTKTVTGKANEAVESAKISFAISNTEQKISECKEKIGDILYREYLKKKDFEGELGELCRKIENLEDDIEVMRDKQAEVKNSRRCKYCVKVNDDKNSFCAECGEKLYEDETEEEK